MNPFKLNLPARAFALMTALTAAVLPATSHAQGGSPTNCAPASTGLVAWWRAQTNALDSAGTNNGAILPGASFAPGEVGTGFYFNGNTNSYIEVPDSPSLELTNELTIEFWVKRLRLDYPSLPYAEYIVEKGGDWTGNETDYSVALHNVTANYCLHFVFAGGWRGGGSIADTNTWHHCAAVARNGDANPTLYIDGVAQPITYSEGASTINLYPSNRPLHIGAMVDPATGWFYFSDTLVDEVSIYNRALSPDEIASIYNAGSNGKCPTNVAPVITSQPVDQTAAAGTSPSFTVRAFGTGPLSYRWFFNSNLLAGATSASLSLSNVQPGQAGYYSVVVTNPYGVEVSSNALLTVLTHPPTIVTQPQGTSAYVGSTVTLSVTAAGTLPLSYLWYKNSDLLPGGFSSSYTIQKAQLADSGYYTVVVTNLYGSATSTNAIVSIIPPPPCTPVPSGIIAWWRAETNTLDSFDSQNGLTNSSSSLPYIFSYTNGKVGSAFNLNGNNFVLVPDSPALRVTSAFTIEAWINPAPLNSALARTIAAKYDYPGIVQPILANQTNSSFFFGITNGGFLCLTVTSNGRPASAVSLFSPNRLTQTTWSHVAATYDGAELQLYINGVQVAQARYSGGVFPGTTDLGLGAVVGPPTTAVPAYPYHTPVWAWIGGLDEISLYNRALTSDEIFAIYHADVTGKCLVPPLITVQPQSQAIPIGEDVLFAPTVLGSKPLSYQWRLNGNNILRATNPTLLLEKVQTNQGGNYSVLITNSVGSILSSNATLTFLPAPSCTPAPTNIISWWPAENSTADIVGTNNPASFVDITYPTGKVGRAFGFNGLNSRLTIPNSPSLNFSSNSTFSIEGWIKILPPAAIAQTPNDNVILFEKRAYAAPVLPLDSGYSLSLYRGRLAFWMASYPVLPIRGSTPSQFVSPGPDLRDGMYHHIAVSINHAVTNGGNLYVDGQLVLNFNALNRLNTLSNSAPVYIGAPALASTNSYFSGQIDELSLYGRALSASEIMAIRLAGAAGKCKYPPIIILQPQSQTVKLGTNATFTVVAAGIPTPKYQWRYTSVYLSGTWTIPIPGATSPTLIIPSVGPGNVGFYSVVVSNQYGSVVSSNAQLISQVAPVAHCTNAVVAAGTNCAAFVQVNDRSYDPNGGSLVTYQTPPGPYPAGQTTVTLTVINSVGLSNQCLSSVQVLDLTPPTIIAPAFVITTNDLNQCGAIVNFPNPTAIDACSAVTSVIWTPGPGTFFPVGTTRVSVRAIDANHNATNYSFNVTVRDTQTPTITCPASVAVTNAHNAWTSVVNFNVTTSDNCPGVSPAICNPPSGSTFPIGDNTVSCSAIDAAGNSSHCTFTVTVHSGNVPPVPVIDVSPLARFPGYTNLIVIAPNNASTAVTFDGSRSYDVDDTNFLYFWYQGTNLFSTNVVAHENLALGSREITLWLDDTFPLGTNATSVTVDVITPAQAVGIIIDMLQNSNLGNRNIQPLLASLNAAVGSFDRANLTAGVNQLAAFQNKVKAQVAPSLPALANNLITSAQIIIDAVSGRASNCGGPRTNCP